MTSMSRVMSGCSNTGWSSCCSSSSTSFFIALKLNWKPFMTALHTKTMKVTTESSGELIASKNQNKGFMGISIRLMPKCASIHTESHQYQSLIWPPRPPCMMWTATIRAAKTNSVVLLTHSVAWMLTQITAQSFSPLTGSQWER